MRKLFHQLRITGNNATHSRTGDRTTALHTLKYARQLGIWYHRTFSNNPNFKAGAFIPPSDPQDETEALKQELAQLRQAAIASRTAAELAQAKALEEQELREVIEKLLNEVEAEAKKISKRNLADLRIRSADNSNQIIQQIIPLAQVASEKIDLSEADTRRLIDAQLRETLWEADTDNLNYQNGTRPEKGRNLAIAEYPTQNGIADHALFVGLQIIAVVEAKRQSKDVYSDVDQAKRYSKGFRVRGEEILCDGSPWGEYQVPFVFATNGRNYLRQLETKSGIWFCDVRKPDNIRRPLQSWYSPQGLIKTLGQDINTSHTLLQQEGFKYNIELRYYQVDAIRTIEAALAEKRRELLLAMATETGKTKTAIVKINQT